MTSKPTLLQSFLPIIVLVLLLFGSVKYIWGDGSLEGGNQMALVLATTVAALIGWRLKVKWQTMMEGITESITSALPAAIILLLIGALAGTWLISGIVPTMIYYGLQILNPTIFLFSACLISSIISLATGSSWSTIATIGVALLGIGQALGIHTGLIAGAIISGAYFGDKMSPMSDTTNLAPAVSGTDLFTHIKYMLWTTVPSISITLILFLIIGFFSGEGNQATDITPILSAIEGSFNISPWLFLVPVVVIFMIIKKVQAIPALFTGVILGGIFAVFFQPQIIKENGYLHTLSYSVNGNQSVVWKTEDGEIIAENKTLERIQAGNYWIEVFENKELKFSAPISIDNNREAASNTDFNLLNTESGTKGITISHSQSSFVMAAYKTIVDAMTVRTEVNTTSADVNDLLSTKGMSGMLGTIWLIICAMSFGGIMDKLGFLERITQSLVSKAKSRGSLIATTTLTCIGFNVTASDQYLAIVVPGKMFAGTFRQRKLAPQNLSRTLEDSGTVTSVLIPWNTCGAAQSNVLGIATGDYFIYCFFNLISPIMTMIYGYIGIKIAKLPEEEPTEVHNNQEN